MNCSFVALFFAFLALSVVAQDEERGFTGRWLDNAGFTVNICVTSGGTMLEGSYNEFGLIQADVYPGQESARGFFWNTRYQTDDECPWGEFNWHINGNSIKGSYVCFDRLSGGEWTLDRIIPQVVPTDAQCYELEQDADDDDMEGRWNLDFDLDDDDDWDICMDDDGNNFYASYGEPGQIGSSYQFGRVFDGGKILQGSALTIVDEYGGRQASGTLIFLSENTDLTAFNWLAPVSDANVLQNISGGHTVVSGVRKISNIVSENNCRRNEDLAIGYEDDDDFIPNLASSPASALSVCFGLIAVLALFF